MLASLALIFWPIEVTDQCLFNENTQIVGLAYNEKNQLLYCEEVSQLGEEQLHINYALNNKIFATKVLTIATTPEKPEVLQKDLRTGETREARVTQEKVSLRYKENGREKEQVSKLNLADIDIIDAGFDNFIRSHWEDFSTSKTNYLPVKFASIAHLRALDLRIHNENLASCKSNLIKQKSSITQKTNIENQKNLERCFVVDIDNFLLRILLGKMQLMYDSQHRLKNYLGPVNITDEAGKTQNASIDYYYATDYLTQQK